ncbi:hypothetical protein [Kumtagia ephedrae]|jgi:hypothetical protein|uniref:Uncharacterized protein n=1 Tax=Kumtagia ephedrae TaxID=2116701 RepID=A0A2P7RK03_9HYPH|nr:hypothetical protein [Mesorhizobium ephedrae]PSJ50537.1 hypothetical protein C7I84_28420 [Mesorhizobium ephedrae]
MKADEICDRYGHLQSGLSLKLLPADGDCEATILIEGPSRALHLLADLLMAVADEKENDGFGLGPRGAGSFHFSKTSEFGVYIHRLDE